MSTTFEHIILKTELSQSDAFGNFYDGILDKNENPSFCNLLVEDVGELLEGILLKNETLTDFQKEALKKIFEQFNIIRTSIDPKRLKSFEHYLNDDHELLLFRESEDGLLNIIINSDECIAFSFIPNNHDRREFYFITIDGDFEKLAYNFLSH